METGNPVSGRLVQRYAWWIVNCGHRFDAHYRCDMATRCISHHNMVPHQRGIHPSNTGYTRGIPHSFLVMRHVSGTMAKLLHYVGTAWAVCGHYVHLPGKSPKITCHLSVSKAKQQSPQDNNQHMGWHMGPRAIRGVVNLAPNTKLGEVQQYANRFVKGGSHCPSVACHSVLFCVGGMEHSDSESNFELHEVDPVVDGFSDDFSETSSEEHQERDSGQEGDGDDVDSGNDNDGADIHDADDVQHVDDAAETENKGTGKKQKRRVETDPAFRLRVCRHFHECKNKKATARKFQIQPKQVRVYLAQENNLKAEVVASKRKARRVSRVGHKPKHPEWEKKALDYVKDMQAQKKKVTRLWQRAVKQQPHKKVLLADALGAHFKKRVLCMFHAANTWVCRIPEGTTSVLQYLDVYFFAI